MEVDLLENLRRARNVLNGLDERGNNAHHGMFSREVISLSHGEAIRRPHPSVVLAGIESLLSTTNSALDDYQFLKRNEELEEAITSHFMQYGVPEIHARNVLLDAGVTRLFQSFCMSTSNLGDEFLCSPSFYHPIPNLFQLFGRSLTLVKSVDASGYKLTVQDLRSHLLNRRSSRRIRGLILFNPTMTGAIYTDEELRDLAKFCEGTDWYVFEDSIFQGTEFRDEGILNHLANVCSMQDRVVTAAGASKLFSLPNLRIAWACGPKNLIDSMYKWTQPTLVSVPQIAQRMAMASFRVPRSYYYENNRECRNRYELISQAVTQVGENLVSDTKLGLQATDLVRISHEPQAGHSVLVEFPALEGLTTPRGVMIRDSIDVVRFFLEEAKVSLAPGLSHGFFGTQCRVSFGCVGYQHLYQSHSTVEQQLVKEWVEADFAIPRQLTPVVDWTLGQNMIRDAFIDRILPAYRTILLLNGSRINKR